MTRTYSLGEFARLMGVHPKTVQRWDRDGTLTAKRTPTGRRVYTDDGCVHDRDTNAAINLELVGRATPEPAQMPTCGDMEALAVEQSATKLPWMNRKLDRRTHVRTNEKAVTDVDPSASSRSRPQTRPVSG